MQILDINTVKKQLTMPMAISAIEDLLKTQGEHPTWIKTPERLVIPTFEDSNKNTSGSHLSMPSVVFDGDNEYAVVKLVTICPDNPKRNKPTTMATITVSDSKTGEMLAFLDGVYITQVRTAALSGIATKYLANPTSSVVAVIGTGGMAYEQLNAILTVRPNIKQVNLWNRTTETAHHFQEKFKQEYPQWQVDFEVYENIESAIKDADIINLATRATKGLFEAAQIKPDAHINAVGAYQPTMKEVSNSVIEASTSVIIDDAEGGLHEAGDLIQAHDDINSTWTWDQLTGTLNDLVNKKISIDLSQDKGITLFKSVGAASFDAAVALKVAQTAQKEGLGRFVEL
ncbi:ornithine cyclodeaminase family protein [Psychrobacter sp. APC 3426]|uniref:ornithine cyclodeaminase family protein n=1 Tax=Psychrobacter sp. APC 3426 TaxID=3035177 RepID=UPI0025B53E9E|nr:Gfo/Idh/MocA family oxidoreductase [Psychrobacter sp. APC 3426]MDN3399696.1 ornithine cyclodeaminase family protein [Psychrobacter sp. APC 3426]